jgi:hypothetical protein
MGSRGLPDAESIWTDPTLDQLGLAILCTLAYADVFDYPLTPIQIHRYLIGVDTDRDRVLRALDEDSWASRRLEQHGAYVTFPHRREVVKLRRRRAEVTAQMWPFALRYGRAIAALPFVRAVMLTGALAVGNVVPGDDVDFLIVTAPGRLWLTRAMVIGLVVKPAARRDHEVCPNYLLSEHTLDFEEQNLYVAHELAQMVPLAGLDIYHRMRAANRWTTRFLPNATGLPRPVEPLVTSCSSARSLTEIALGTFVGGQLERFERRRKIRRFAKQGGGMDTACFSADRCKGHFESNEQVILASFDERLRALADP